MWLRPHGLKRCSTVLCVLRDSNISELRARLTRARPGAAPNPPRRPQAPTPSHTGVHTFTTTALRICDVHTPAAPPRTQARHVASMTRALSTLHSSIFFSSYLLIERRFDGQRPWSTCVPDQCFAAARKPTSNEPTKQNLISVSTSHLSGVARSCDHQRTVHAS